MTLFMFIRQRIEIRCNRLRHPDLMRREANGESPLMIAQEMLSRDLRQMEIFAEAYGTSVTIRRPVLSDYYVKPRRVSRSFVGSRRTVSQ